MKTYLYLTPNVNGTINDETNDFFETNGIPEGMVEVPDELLPKWEKFKPYATLTVENGKIIAIEDNPKARTVPIEKQRENKLKNLNGMCSGAIYSGLDIGTYHYNFSEKTQINLEKISRNISKGQTTILYRADNEAEQRNYTVDEMNVIIKTQDEWIAVNTNYYEKLKKWINRETDETVLKAVVYGSTLPTDLMQELATKLSSVGIDINKYATALGGE